MKTLKLLYGILLFSSVFFIVLTHKALADSDNKAALTENLSQEGERMEKIQKSKEEWKKLLTPEQYQVMREKGTERAFTGKYYDHKEKGMYRCAGCGAELFSSDAKFDSGTGWPSFSQPVSQDGVEVKDDSSHGMQRKEVLCNHCNAHLGHVFDDGPGAGGKRFCINSAALNFNKKQS